MLSSETKESEAFPRSPLPPPPPSHRFSFLTPSSSTTATLQSHVTVTNPVRKCDSHMSQPPRSCPCTVLVVRPSTIITSHTLRSICILSPCTSPLPLPPPHPYPLILLPRSAPHPQLSRQVKALIPSVVVDELVQYPNAN
jgi:hypothetical protein